MTLSSAAVGSSARTTPDLVRKKRIHHRHRVSHYWVIDPEAEMLTVYRHAPEGYLEALVAVRGETVRAEPFEARELAAGVLFGVTSRRSSRWGRVEVGR